MCLNYYCKIPILYEMESIVFLYAVTDSQYVFEASFDGKSAAERSLTWAKPFASPHDVFVACLSSTEQKVQAAASNAGVTVKTLTESAWNTQSLLEAVIKSCSDSKADRVLLAPLSAPFLDAALTQKVTDAHERYCAEYTCADGYPKALAPELLASSTAVILRDIIKDKPCASAPVDADCIMNALKTDINSFEVESVLSPRDWRYLRLDFTTETKRTYLACCNLFQAAKKEQSDFSAQNLSVLAAKTASVQCTVPAYYAIQLTTDSRTTVTYNAFAAGYKKQSGTYPTQGIEHKTTVLDLASLKTIAAQISELSDDATVCLGCGSEPLLHPDFTACVKTLLDNPKLRILIETDGTLVTPELASQIASLDADGRITWIVCLDAASEATYLSIHVPLSEAGGRAYFTAAVSSVGILSPLFKGRVYPQMVRMNANETELEQFYRYWHDAASPSEGNVIIQKYDSCAGFLSDEKPADLSPLVRTPCWHVKRDMIIRADGSVPLCQALIAESSELNVCKCSVEEAWKQIVTQVPCQVSGEYPSLCRKCDEYYTFNF